ncbi:MAG: molybdopterin-synthase adenylyltransferase MoeB [Acidimicrobiales bacterium]|nr:molybdopterin-synthase adenylyltransferase MoeB [Acidimicrobiales bacterium]RZV42446.1 MAG: molybdopterin-synthase adenylyltransferase MoeB [Acidimicrobiales bacterium]
MTSLRELLDATRDRVTEVGVHVAAEMIASGAVPLDVREAEELVAGTIAGSTTITRGQLELSIETAVPDKETPLVVLCGGGTRSLLAADSLATLGYHNVVSMTGGFNAWKDAGLPWGDGEALDTEQRARYQRHLSLPEVGEAGQQTLLASKVLLLGAGGLGSPAALYLAAAGVGTLGIVDMDVVDASNLQRQVIHSLDRVGQKKVDSAAETIRRLNPDVQVHAHAVRLDAGNVLELIEGYDVIIDGADNFPARYLLNDASVKLGIPVVHGSIFRFEGQVSVFDPQRGPTYRDMLPTPPAAEFAPSCAEAGVLGALPGIVGSLQAIEAIKLLLGLGDPLIGRLLVFDALDMAFSEYALNSDPENPVTFDRRDLVEVSDLDELCSPNLVAGLTDPPVTSH